MKNLYKIIRRRRSAGQVSLEFTFAIVATILLIWGMIRVFRWAGLDLAKQIKAYESTQGGYDEDFYQSGDMKATVPSNLFVSENE